MLSLQSWPAAISHSFLIIMQLCRQKRLPGIIPNQRPPTNKARTSRRAEAEAETDVFYRLPLGDISGRTQADSSGRNLAIARKPV